jgi:hypothetical protein
MENEEVGSVPDTLLTCTEVAPLTCHASVVLCPSAMLAGVAVKLLITGSDDGGGLAPPPQLLRSKLSQRKAPAPKLARMKLARITIRAPAKSVALIGADCKGSSG